MEIYNGPWKVYAHVNKVNGKMYIGITSQKLEQRFGANGCGYRKHNVKFWRAICKYGWNSFDHVLLADHLTEEEANNMEMFLINQLDTVNDGYNCRGGGKAGKLSEDSRQKIREKRALQVIPREAIDHLAEINRGKSKSEAFKARDRECKRKYMVRIYCEETSIYYESISDASRKTGISKGSLSSAVHGFTKTAGGFHWRLIESLTTIPMGVGSSDPKWQSPALAG